MDKKKTIVADIPDEVLSCSTENSDRLVYSNYYVPVAVVFDKDAPPILPFYKKQVLIELSRYSGGLGDTTRGLLEEIAPGVWDQNAMDQASDNLPRTDYDGDPADEARRRPTLLGLQQPEFLAGLLQSDVGYVFLDRTRIRPVGFALGEHVFSLGLAPGEEVVLEQKAFTKRQVTFEEQTEQEKQFDVELTSTLSTEIQEGFDRQKSLSDTWGLNLSHTGQYATPQGLPWGSINASHTLGYTKNVTEASQETSRRSVKDSREASSKVSAKYRTQHKTSFKVVSEQGTESASKRTVKNPNRTSALTLHYFKILQRLQMRQERYGARLCWAPSIKDPGFAFVEKIRQGRAKIVDDALRSLPTPPKEPARPIPDNAPPPASESKTFRSEVTSATGWHFDGGINNEYLVEIPIEQGFRWDEGVVNIAVISDRSPVNKSVVGTPYTVHDDTGSKLRVLVHIDTTPWMGGPPVNFQASANFTKVVTIAVAVADDAKYADDIAAYRTLQKEWADKKDEALAKAHQDGDAFEATLLDGLNPVGEMISQIVARDFPAAYRDEAWEVDFWQRVFDWERASFVCYPSWWSAATPRHLELDPANFINASWAKLYLPVRAGMEVVALRWIYGKAIAGVLPPKTEAAFANLVDDLQKFRGLRVGSPDEMPELTTDCQEIPEKIYCMAKWNELMPTDGTHIEVMQAITTAADPVTALEIADAESLRAVVIENERSALALRDKAKDQMTQPADLQITIGAAAAEKV